MNPKNGIAKITSLWALTECGLGGFFHSIQSPFTGLIVGGLSIIYICLIALMSSKKQHKNWHARFRTISIDVGGSAILVLIIKALMSPHSPIGAYFAVSLQAIVGIMFFGFIQRFKVAALLASVIATVSSAVQKILILIILFGYPLFEAIDGFVIDAASKLVWFDVSSSFSTSETLASIYILTYAFGGIIIGLIAIQLPDWLNTRSEELATIIEGHTTSNKVIKKSTRKQPLTAAILFLLLLSLSVLFQYFFVSSTSAIWQLIRTVSVIAIWLIFVRPIFKWWIKRLADKQRPGLKEQIAHIERNLPKMASFVPYAFKQSRSMKGFWMSNFILLFIYFGLNET